MGGIERNRRSQGSAKKSEPGPSDARGSSAEGSVVTLRGYVNGTEREGRRRRSWLRRYATGQSFSTTKSQEASSCFRGAQRIKPSPVRITARSWKLTLCPGSRAGGGGRLPTTTVG